MTDRAPSAARPLRALWQVHPPVTLMIGAAPEACLHTLLTATRPSTSRLHHRELFHDGRRYYVQRQSGGFRLTSDTRVFWGSKRQRTRSVTLVTGAFSRGGSDSQPVTFLRLRAQMKLAAALSALLLPAFISSILIALPWDPAAVLVLIAALFSLSWVSQRFNAAYQANEIVYFISRVMEDLPAVEVAALPERGPDVVIDPAERTFLSEWERFYDAQTGGDDWAKTDG